MTARKTGEQREGGPTNTRRESVSAPSSSESDLTTDPQPGLDRTTTETELVSDLCLHPSSAFKSAEIASASSPPQAPEHRFVPGTILAERYRIIDLIGRGGMGEVYRAEDLKLGQPVALKFLPESMAQNAKWQARFLDEVKISRQISHPNVCRVYDLGEADGQPFITMEYIDGEDLASLLRQIGRLPQAKAVDIGRQICHGLAAAHQRGFLHRDLKPSNLMVDSQGIARITDFGLAAIADQIAGSDIRQGTPSYMSPEQFSGREISLQSDLYALGLVLYKLFTGQAAFQANSRAELSELHRETLPSPPSMIVPDLHPAIERAILWCLEKEPANRPQSALVVAAALASYRTSGGDTVLKSLLYCRFEASIDRSDAALQLNVLLERYEGQRLIRGDDQLLFFDRPILATEMALALTRYFRDPAKPKASGVRSVIHLAEVGVAEDDSNVARPSEAARLEVQNHHRQTLESLSRLAQPGQILFTRGAFDLARQSALDGFGEIRWLAHGSYEIDALAEPIEIFEVGVDGQAPLTPPPESQTARRQLAQGTISGWRPAPHLELPERPHWIIERKLGQGGFGEVWLASHQKTGERRVFKFCYDSASLRSLQREITLFRLLKETLGHRQDITRILDWNFDEPPYFIEAEYTEGGSLLEWSASQNGLDRVPLATRLELIAQVATALAAAHSVGVLHKDVKPANVLVITDEEEHLRAQLSDFGVGLVTEKGRLIDAGITVLGWTEQLDDPFASSAGFGTPLYLAPELLEGKPPTLQADIYALGVMLYQMIVGDFSRALAPGWEDEIDDDLLVEDIAAAVAGVPERRLSDALQLAERLRTLEVRRARLEEAMREREETRRAREALERSRKRRRITALLILVLTLFAGAMFVQSQRAEREAEAARQIADFLENLYKGLGPGDSDLTMLDLLERSATRVAAELGDQPWTQAKLYNTIGNVYFDLGRYEQALDLLQQSLDLRRRLHGERHPETVESLHDLANALHENEGLDEAETMARRALEIRRELFGDEDAAVAESLELLAHIILHSAATEEAVRLAEEALQIRRELDEEAKAAATLDVLGYLFLDQGDDLEAEERFREALEIRRSIFDDKHLEVASSLDNIGYVLQQRGDIKGALGPFRQALDIRQRQLPADHPELGDSLRNVAGALKTIGWYEEAEVLLREALELQIDRDGEDHPLTAAPMTDLALLLIERRKFDEAQTLLQQAYTLRDKDNEEDWYMAFILDGKTELMRRQGRYQEARALAEQALAIRRQLGGDLGRPIAHSLEIQAQIEQELGQYQQAENLLLEAERVRRTLNEEQHGLMARTKIYRALLAREREDFRKAEELLLEARQIRIDWKGEKQQMVAWIENLLARVQLDQGKFESALAWSQRASALLVEVLPQGSWQFHQSNATVAVCLAHLGRFEESEKLLVGAYEALKEQLGRAADPTQQSLRDLVSLYRLWGKNEEADRYLGILMELEAERLVVTTGPAEPST